jgi:hypothetical protein
MMLFSELRLKAGQTVEALIDGMGDALQRLDEIEKSLFRGLLALGRELLQGAVDEVTAGEERDAAASLRGADGAALRKIKRQSRRLVTVFGELSIDGPVCAVRKKQKIQRALVDERLGLPSGEFSYLVEDWAQRMVVKDAFAEAADSLHELLGLKVLVRSLEGMNRRVAADVEAFREQQPAPADDGEGGLLAVLSDATGVPLQHRGGAMRMAYLGASYTVDRFRRSVDRVLERL